MDYKIGILFLSLALLFGTSQCTPYKSVRTIQNAESTPERTHRLFSNYAHSGGDLKPAEHELKDVGSPLFITPYLKEGKIQEARDLSLVVLPNDTQNTRSFSGFLTVDEKFKSNMFFWFFPAKKGSGLAPLVVWLQGGPGGSSMFGLFFENGPFGVDMQLRLVPRNTSWSNEHNLLYFDNPVGTGFSFTDSDGYCKDETCVGEGLYSALQQFLELFPELRSNPLHVTGESYAGKYVPAMAYTIHEKNPTADKKINLKGIAIGDGLCDPRTMTDYGDFLYSVGLANAKDRDVFRARQKIIQQDIDNKDWMAAFRGFDSILNGDVYPYPSLFANVTALTDYYNYIVDKASPTQADFGEYLNLASVRKAIHVGDLTFHAGTEVEDNLLEDMMQSVKPWIEVLLTAGYDVVLYNGQVDIIIAWPLTRAFVDTLQWPGAQEYQDAHRRIWKVHGAIAGYTQSAQNFTVVVVRAAGHLVPHDQPDRAYDLIRRITGVHEAGFLDL